MSVSQPKRRPSGTYLHRNRRVRVPDGHMAIGLITSAHGLRGEVKVELHTDFPDRFAPGVRVYLGEDLNPVTITQARPHQGQMLLVFEGINTREQTDALRDLWIFIPDDQAVDLDEDTFFVHDIIGLTAVTDTGRVLGKVTDVLFTGANEVYVVATQKADGSQAELLLPAIAEVIQHVDVAAGVITITPLPGLLEEEPADAAGQTD